MKPASPSLTFSAAWAVFRGVLLLGAVVAVGAVAAVAAATQEDAASAKETGAETITFKGLLPETLPIPGDPRPFKSSPYAEQIDKALAYMAFKNRDANRQVPLVILDYLQRRYGLHQRYSLSVQLAPHLTQAADMSVDERFLRLTQPGHHIDREVIEAEESHQRLLLRALYCCDYPMEEEILNDFDVMLKVDNDIMFVSVGVAYLWLQHNGCASGDTKYIRIRDEIAVKLRAMLRRGGASAELSHMALCILYGLGHGKMVEEDWIDALAKTQNEDGGWSTRHYPEQEVPSDGNATIHALWALLEHALPDAPQVPLLPRPDGAENESSSTDDAAPPEPAP